MLQEISVKNFVMYVQLILTLIFYIARGEVIDLKEANIDSTLKSHDIILVNFYADWCHFSQLLSPIFADAAAKAKTEFPNPGKVALAKVDCDKEVAIAQKYHVNKYPTLKLFRYGEVMKREYRGQRSVDAMIQFLKDQSSDKIANVKSLGEYAFEDEKRYIIGHFDKNDGPVYNAFKKVAAQHQDDCVFIITGVEGDSAPNTITAQEGKGSNFRYTGNESSFEDLVHWTKEKCIPLVREITFSNAEELTEEGLPFLLLFHKPEDKESVRLFHEAVKRELLHERYNVNFLTGDGLQFSHPLHHLGKGAHDLPVICIDSFRHMYIHPKGARDALTNPGSLRKFVEDLQSGKLHREFHNGPDPEVVTPKVEVVTPKQEEVKKDHVPRDGSNKQDRADTRKGASTTPPVSMFRLLQPSSNRYTLLRDEL